MRSPINPPVKCQHPVSPAGLCRFFHPSGTNPCGPSRIGRVALLFFLFFFSLPSPSLPSDAAAPTCLKRMTTRDAFLLADPRGRILVRKNETRLSVPASTLKVLTALTAIHHLGETYRFKTEFYRDTKGNLKVKGYGDPLLISEVWEDIARALARKMTAYQDLVLDDGYFSKAVDIPGRGRSTNPYDAPVGALCANFNTVFFECDPQGNLISSEPQTPMIPYIRRKIESLGLRNGRHTFSHDAGEAPAYAGALLRHFLEKEGVHSKGVIRPGRVAAGERPLFTYRSQFDLNEVLRRMLKYSNNFIANQVFLLLGARCEGPPATLEKGVRVVMRFSREVVGIRGIQVVEGSGISRRNRLSALHMLRVLERFKPHRRLLNAEPGQRFKTGSLHGIRTRVGYVFGQDQAPHAFVIFLNRSPAAMNGLVDCARRMIAE